MTSEGSDELPDGFEDITPRSYFGDVIPGRCTDEECGLEAGITTFDHDIPSFCPGTEEYNDALPRGEPNGHMTIWEELDDV